MKIPYSLFLAVGIWRTYNPSKPKDGTLAQPLTVPREANICRRNILALATILVVAGAAGGDPQELSVFGLKPSGGWGDIVLGVAAIGAQIYWYVMRYLHEDAGGLIPLPHFSAGVNSERPARPVSEEYDLERKTADLWANRLAFFLTLGSWFFIGQWILCSHA